MFVPDGPPTGCSVSTDVGNVAFVPNTADYIFYSDTPPKEDAGAGN